MTDHAILARFTKYPRPGGGIKIGEVRSATGAVWEVRWSHKGITMAGGAPIDPDDASALARLLLDAAHECRVARERHRVAKSRREAK